MAHDPFAGFQRFAGHVLQGVDEGDRSARKFKYLLGVIARTLADTHGMVVDRLAALRQARTFDEANRILEELRLDNLTEAFRVEGMCDLLEGLGTALISRTYAADGEGAFEVGELFGVRDFAQRLYDREAEVARLYSEVLQEVTALGPVRDPIALRAVQDRAEQAESRLTDQVSDFTAKADRFLRVPKY